jgi:hypothetical protein
MIREPSKLENDEISSAIRLSYFSREELLYSPGKMLTSSSTADTPSAVRHTHLYPAMCAP